jgi:hypothetical protein
MPEAGSFALHSAQRDNAVPAVVQIYCVDVRGLVNSFSRLSQIALVGNSLLSEAEGIIYAKHRLQICQSSLTRTLGAPLRCATH